MAKIVQRGDSTSPTRRQVAKRSSFAGFSMNKLVSDAKTPLLVLGGMWLGRKTYIALTQNSTVSGIFGVDGKKLAVPIAQILGGLTFSQLVKNKDWAPIGWGFAVSGGLQIIKDTFNKDILAGFLGETPEAANFELPELNSKMMGLGEPDLSMEELDKELERAIKEEGQTKGFGDNNEPELEQVDGFGEIDEEDTIEIA